MCPNSEDQGMACGLPDQEPKSTGRTTDPGEILRRRARELARPPLSREWERDALPVVEFVLSGERYALDAAQIQEVAPIRALLALPGTPDFVLGIISLRGEIYSVVDLRKVFALPEQSTSRGGFVVILQDGDMEFGIYAEAVPGAAMLHPSDLTDSLPTLTDMQAEFLKGVTSQGLVYLDAGRLLTDPRLNVAGSKGPRVGRGSLHHENGPWRPRDAGRTQTDAAPGHDGCSPGGKAHEQMV